MRSHSRRFLCASSMAVVMLTVSCGDDDGTPSGVAPEEIVLARTTGGGSSSGFEEPEPAMVIEIGVSEELLPSYGELPDPLVFSNRTFGDNTNYIARPFDAAGLGVMADRLTDGMDTTLYLGVHTVEGGGSSSFGPESQALGYNMELSRPGPDLQGFTITGLQVQLDIEVTESGGLWTLAYEYTLSILGH